MRDFWQMSGKMLEYNGKLMGEKGESDCARGGEFRKRRYCTCRVSRESKSLSTTTAEISDDER